MEVLYHGIKTRYALCFPHELIMIWECCLQNEDGVENTVGTTKYSFFLSFTNNCFVLKIASSSAPSRRSWSRYWLNINPMFFYLFLFVILFSSNMAAATFVFHISRDWLQSTNIGRNIQNLIQTYSNFWDETEIWNLANVSFTIYQIIQNVSDIKL